jgi:ABC-type sulfate/molybdate transport systems ATPase subunit
VGDGEVETTLELRDLHVTGARVSLTTELGDVVAVRTDPQTATTLARTVVGLAAPLSGQVLVGGRDVTGMPPGSRQIGYLPAGGALLPHLTVEQNIEYLIGRHESVRDLTRNWKSVLVQRLELGPLLHLRPHELSDLQRIRAALARAVLSLPEALVLDLPDAPDTWSPRALLRHIRLPDTPGPSTVVFTADPAMDGGADRVVCP